jgi:dolichol kinase
MHLTTTAAAAAAAAAAATSTTAAALAHDLALTGALLAVASAWLLALQAATGAGRTSTRLNRKIVHITCAPGLMLCWPLYSDLPTARVAAAVLPLFFIARLLWSANANHTHDDDSKPRETARDQQQQQQQLQRSSSSSRSISTLAASITRNNGDDTWEDALRGPLVYLAVLSTVTLVFWRGSPASAVILGQLCFGDGFADIVGRQFGRGTEWTLPNANGKTVVGSVAFSVAGFLGSSALWSYFLYAGCLTDSLANPAAILDLVVISILCGAVEVLAPGLDDNSTVSFTAACLSLILKI